MLLWEGVAFSFLSITEPLLPLLAHHAPWAPPGPGAARRPEALQALAPRASVSYL